MEGNETTATQEESGSTELSQLLSAQGVTSFSEAELTGPVDAEPLAEPPAEPSAEVTTPEPVAEEAKTSPEEPKTTEQETANSEPKVEKVPKGYVPLAAVHEARGEIKYLKEQVAALQVQVNRPPSEPSAPAEDFEILSDEVFEELADDNPAQAAIYLRKLAIHQENVRKATEETARQAQFAQAYETIIDTAVSAMEQVVPGIFEENSETQKELLEFAETVGFTEDLYYLTNPSTKIILPGETEPLLLGEQAASVLKMLVTAKSKISAPSTEEALRAKITEEVTAELMKKFKTPDATQYRGLNQVPKSDSEPPTEPMTDRVLTADQLAKLSEAEYVAYLAGN